MVPSGHGALPRLSFAPICTLQQASRDHALCGGGYLDHGSLPTHAGLHHREKRAAVLKRWWPQPADVGHAEHFSAWPAPGYPSPQPRVGSSRSDPPLYPLHEVHAGVFVGRQCPAHQSDINDRWKNAMRRIRSSCIRVAYMLQVQDRSSLITDCGGCRASIN
jgi:hypothetical protein